MKALGHAVVGASAGAVLWLALAANTIGQMAAPFAASVTTAEEIARTMSAPRTRGLVKVPGSAPEPAQPAIRMAFPNVQFALNSAQLLPAARAQLDQIGRALVTAELAGMTFEVRGHTDVSGGAAFNLSLSRARAAAVRSYLISHHGAARERLKARGVGATELRDDLADTDWGQRRVELIRR